MTKSEQLLALIEHYSGGNKAKFALKMGLKPSSIASWITRNTFDVDIIYAKCEHISAHWLLTGEGDMLRGEGDEEIKRGGDDSLDGRLSSIIDVLREENKRLQDDNRELNREIGRLEVRLEQALSNKE
jgi:hypothetical protein